MSEIHNYLEPLYSCNFPVLGALKNGVVLGRESTPVQARGRGVAEDNYWTLPKINEISMNIIRENTYLAVGE